MTKEEILESIEVPHFNWLRCKGTTPSVYLGIIKAMEEYAKQESIAFAEWIMLNQKIEKFTDGEHAWYEVDLDKPMEVTEIYQIFLNLK